MTGMTGDKAHDGWPGDKPVSSGFILGVWEKSGIWPEISGSLVLVVWCWLFGVTCLALLDRQWGSP